MEPCLQCGEPVKRKDAKFCCYPCSVEWSRRSLPVSKPCTVCGKTMVRGDRQEATKWRNQATCSETCRYRLISRKGAKKRTIKPASPKTCVVCGKVFAKRKSESHSTFAVKKTCGRICAAVLVSEARSFDWQPKPCEWCGDMFSKRDNELGKQFSRRRCCSDRCRIELALDTRSNGQPSKSRYPRKWNAALKRLIRERDGFACRECGVIEEGRAHHVHHIDYVRSNLDESNLITLCHSCHSKTCNRANMAYYIERYSVLMEEGELAA